MLSPSQTIYTSQIRLNVESTFEIEIVLIAIITCGKKLLSADWLRQRAFFLNHERTFGNEDGMIT